jgi:hypothetical protein
VIRRDASRLDNAPSLEALHGLGARLADHVELEERELFPLIEQTVPEHDLSVLGERLRDASQVIPAVLDAASS